jgi:hypothetical protein
MCGIVVGAHHHSVPSITSRIAAEERDAQTLFHDDILTIPYAILVLYLMARKSL